MLNRMYLYINTHTTDHVYVALTILNRLSSPQILSHAPWITTLLSPTCSLSTPMNISGFISLSRPSSSMGLDLILPSEAPFAQHRTHYMAVGIFAGCAVTCMHACVTQCVPVFETFLCSLNHFHFLSISWLHMELIYNVRTGSSTTVTQCQCHCHDKISFLVATLRKLLPLGHTAFYCPYRIIASYLSSLSLYCTD